MSCAAALNLSFILGRLTPSTRSRGFKRLQMNGECDAMRALGIFRRHRRAALPLLRKPDQVVCSKQSSRGLKLWIIGRSLPAKSGRACDTVRLCISLTSDPFLGERISQPQLCWWPFFMFVSAQSMDEWFTGQAKSVLFAAVASWFT